jgi:hypothetical protein
VPSETNVRREVARGKLAAMRS